MSSFYPDADTSATAEEREALTTLAPVRMTLERVTRKMLERAAGPTAPPIDPKLVELAIEAHWTLILESYRRGVRLVHRAMHRGEGLDHQMIDQAVDFAMRDMLEEQSRVRARAKK